ncbi:unnamed protein product, partial [Rotaria sp. Silwood1]
DATITGSDADFDGSYFESTSIPTTTTKRKHTPSKSSNTKKILKQSVNNAITSPITIDHETSQEEKEETVLQSPKISSVWKYAKRSRDKKYAICLLCDKHISTVNWSTTSIRRHLIEVHDTQELILSDDNKKKTSTISQRLKEKFHKLSVKAIIKDNLPFNAFNNTGLSKLIQEAIPGYRPIHRNAVARKIKRLYSKHRNKLIEQLKLIETLTITLDFWSDRTNRGFLVVTEGLNILHKINRIVTDGASNLSKAVSLIKTNAQHIWCIGHRLHLAVTNALALWPKKQKRNIDESNQGKKINS